MARRGRTFYQRALPFEQGETFVQASREAQVDDEIALVRTTVHLLAAGAGKDVWPLPEQTLMLRAIDLLARLIRLKSQLQPDQGDLLTDLNEEILRELERGG
ncbi:MAG: hypothetical protein ACYDAG_06465 [Chloroflexota bacterium]